VESVRPSARLRLDPLDVARAALVFCRLVWLLRASSARRGGQLSGDPAIVARVGFDLARAVQRASAASDDSEERRASLERAAAAIAELASVVRVTDDMGALLRLAAELVVGRSPETPPRPPKASH
jgi:hypothetical protein